ncbi:hypothetical protein SYNPS1DRAFT_28574 [Syncephalis pseudoplumigaleata]|uniref:Uncharacterized protein n=1 Tax=Syncephalis pseudoplumigaleata TaxID=1712513 RepID=A0A4V1J1N7_9FUNG|nr:hypothetical protein SYNPS1DRAFT_28574 [Syncephalis pseudoplumigaleata]|eukprot:RKP25699.1 hypothetical protein SYNPS1DRAFT_28574 [Syncephalis pseudoplumigaleata]
MLSKSNCDDSSQSRRKRSVAVSECSLPVADASSDSPPRAGSDSLDDAALLQSVPLSNITRQHAEYDGDQPVLSTSMPGHSFLSRSAGGRADDSFSGQSASRMINRVHSDIGKRHNGSARDQSGEAGVQQNGHGRNVGNVPGEHAYSRTSSYFPVMPQYGHNHAGSTSAPRLSHKDSAGSAGWRRLRRYIMHPQPNWAHLSPASVLPPLPLPMTPGHFSASPTSFDSNHRYMSNPFGPGMMDWRGDLDPIVHVVLDDGTIRQRRMTSRSFSEPDTPLPLQQGIDANMATSASSVSQSESEAEHPSSSLPANKHYHGIPGSASEQQSGMTASRWYDWPVSMMNRVGSHRIPLKHRRTLKAAFAYFVGSLATFWEVPFEWIGGQSTHLAALSIFFFNPARTRGALLESILFGLIGMVYGCLITSAVALLVVYLNVHDHTTMSKWAGVVGVGGIGTFGVAAAKAWLKRPSAYTAGSVASLTMYVGLARILADEPHVKHIDWDALIGPQLAFLAGILISLVVNYTLWTQKASDDLRNDVASTLQSFNGLLKILVKTFLLDGDAPVDALPAALAAHRQSFASLKKSLHEAQLEPADPIWPQLPAYAALIDSLNILTQNISSLSSCVGLQREMLVQQRLSKVVATFARKKKQARRSGPPSNDAPHNATATPGDSNKGKQPAGTGHCSGSTASYSSATAQLGAQGEEELRIFLEGIGPVMRALSYTCKRTMTQMHRSITTGVLVDTGRLQSNLALALVHFNREKSIALRNLYVLFGRKRAWAQIKAGATHSTDDGLSMPFAPSLENGEGDAVSESVFPVYFFLFSLQYFAQQLEKVIEQFNQLQMARKHSWWAAIKERIKSNWPMKLLFDIGNDAGAEVVWQRFDPKSIQDTLHSPRPRTTLQRFSLSLVKLGDRLKQFKMRYAIKSALFAMLLIAPAFMDDWREVYQNYRGEWSVISMAVVMTPTVGGSNVVGIYRIIGTVCGSLVAYLAYTLFPGSRTILPCVAFLFALPCFHLIMHSSYPRVGQVSCMTFTTVLMSQYAVYEDDELEIRDVALTRALMVTVGSVVGLLATLYVWPYEARVELRRGLCDFFINLNLLYHKMISLYSKSWREEEFGVDETPSAYTEDTPLLSTTKQLSETDRLARSYQQFLALELLLQLKLLRLQDLLALTRNEPRFKGPFPVAAYGRLLGHCQALIDHMLTLRMAITDVNWVQQVRKKFIQPVQKERRQMIGAIELYMYSVAAALLLKMPMPAYLPPVAETWHALMARVRQLPEMRATITLPSSRAAPSTKEQAGAGDHDQAASLQSSIDQWHMEDERYILYFAYVLVTGDVVRELEGVGACLRDLYGVMGGSQAQFEACFEA